jgi:hypothetical protein
MKWSALDARVDTLQLTLHAVVSLLTRERGAIDLQEDGQSNSQTHARANSVAIHCNNLSDQYLLVYCNLRPAAVSPTLDV